MPFGMRRVFRAPLVTEDQLPPPGDPERRPLVRDLVQEAASAVGGHKFSLHFLLTEWEQVVDACSDQTKRAVTENARTLNFKNADWE